ncbi:MAG: DNA-protecting protein DprA [Bryobacteraceae bacterium]|nr:DNA-protecting protein DprA [Bryobacteraceae bacterium]
MPATLLRRSDEEMLHWSALSLVPGLGARKSVQLLQSFGSVESLFRATKSELMAAGLPSGLAQSVASGCAFDAASEQVERIKSAGAALLPLVDELYPEQLRQIYDPPVVLYALGRLELLQETMVAIVGSRRSSPYGTAVAERFGRELASRGITVVSGMARGIDTAAHVGALEGSSVSRCSTIAVFAGGLDVIYPAENRKLAERIAREGLIVTEHPFGVPTYPTSFPARNRIVSGLSAGVVVVEGEQYSGSAVTARLALDQNREVFAVPGNITSSLSYAPNLLIRQGAQLVQSVEDILSELPAEARRRAAERAEGGGQRSLPLPPSPPQASALRSQVLSFLNVDQATDLDTLTSRLVDFSPSEIIAALFDLELEGTVRQLPGRCYVKVWTEAAQA